MKVDLWLYAMIGMANASALGARSPRPEGAIGAAAADEYPQEEYPKEEYPKEEYPKEEYKEDDYPKEDYPKEDYPKEDYPKDDYPKDDYPKEDYPKDDYPKDDYPKDDYPKDDYPKDDYPKDDYPKDDYPKDDYPKDDYPKDDYPKEDYPKDDYPKDDYKDDYKPDKSYPEYPDKTYPSTDYSKGKYYKDEYGSEYPKDKKPKAWKPKTHHPEFFSLKVDDKCVKPAEGVVQTDEEKAAAAEACKLEGYAIRLEKGIVVATPYNKWWDPKLPIWFVDDDTSAYTVSKKPLQIYVDNETGALRYAPVGWLPPNSISKSFYKLGNNPLGKVGPSPAYFAWPTTEGRANNLLSGPAWWFCPISYTGQYQVFISDYNFGKSGQGGVSKSECRKGSLAAVNANPWKSKSY